MRTAFAAEIHATDHLSTPAPAAVPASGLTPCQEQDPELWFAQEPATIEQAKTQCAACPLRRQCLEGALERAEPWGVWGGQLLLSGEIVAKKRGRGRPRKVVEAAA